MQELQTKDKEADHENEEAGETKDEIELKPVASTESLLPTCPEPSFDDYMDAVGRRHRYQAAFMFTIGLAVSFPSMQIHSVNFTMLRRPFTCIPAGRNLTGPVDWAATANLSTCNLQSLLNVPDTENATAAVGIPCQRFVFNDADPMSETIVESFGLVCGWETIATVVKVMFMLGFLAGSTCYGILSDRWGRRNAYLLACVNLAIGGVIAAFVKEVAAYAMFRFVAGFAASGLLTVCFAWHTEMQHSRHRFLFTMLMKQGWSAGIFLLTCAAYMTRDWRLLELTISAPALLLLLAHFYVVESPRWLMQTGRACDATDALRRMASINQRVDQLESFLADRDRRLALIQYRKEMLLKQKQQQIQQQLQQQQQQQQQQSRRQRKSSSQVPDNEDVDGAGSDRLENGRQSLQSLQQPLQDKNQPPAQLQQPPQKNVSATAPLAQLLSRPATRTVALAVWSVFAMVSFGYYGLSLGWSDFGLAVGGSAGSSPFVAMALGACAEVAARLLGTACGLRLGRVRLLAGSMGLGGAALILTAALHSSTVLPVGVAISLALAGRFGLLLAFELVWLYASEVFPTSARNSAVGVGSTAARVGGVLAPEVSLLSKLWPQLPLTVCGVVSLAGCCLSAALLPETRGRQAPDTLDEAEKLMLDGRGRGCFGDCRCCRCCYGGSSDSGRSRRASLLSA